MEQEKGETFGNAYYGVVKYARGTMKQDSCEKPESVSGMQELVLRVQSRYVSLDVRCIKGDMRGP